MPRDVDMQDVSPMDNLRENIEQASLTEQELDRKYDILSAHRSRLKSNIAQIPESPTQPF